MEGHKAELQLGIFGQVKRSGLLEYELTVNFLHGDVDVISCRLAFIADD